jgi:hypothetical protein
MSEATGQENKIQSACAHLGILGQKSLDDPSELPSEVLMFYRQKELKLNDPIGDFALVKVSSSNFNDALRSLLKMKKKPINLKDQDISKNCANLLFNLPPEVTPEFGQDNLYLNSEEYNKDKLLLHEILSRYSDLDRKKIRDLFDSGQLVVEGRKDPFDPVKLSQELISIIQDEEKGGLIISQGEIHRWSDEFKAKRSGFNEKWKSLPSKILTVLSGGKSASLLKAGTEEELREFIISQDNLSLTIPSLFRKSLQVNQGNIYLSLLTIENVLSEHWLHPQRYKLKQTNKLKPIARVFGSHGDVFGHWYHLFGMIYYAYAEGAFMAKVSGKTEAIGSLVLSGFKGEAQENRMNMLGAEIGVELRKFIRAKEKSETFLLKEGKAFKQEDLKKRLNKKIKKILRKK